MIIASCGHELTEDEGFGNHISIVDWDRENKRCICHLTVCDVCMKWYKSKHLILTQEEIDHFWD